MNLVLKTLAGITVALACSASASAQTVYIGSSPEAAKPVKPQPVDQAKRFAAYKVAGMLGDRNFSALVERELAGKDDAVMLKPLLGNYANTSVQAEAAADSLRSTDLVVRQSKAIAAETDSVMDVRLYTPKKFAGKVDWKNLLVAYPPSSKKNEYAAVEAFDRKGGSHMLDGRSAPNVPVLIVGINRKEAHRAGVELMNKHLQAVGMQGKTMAKLSGPAAMATPAALSAGIETSKLDRIRLNNDQEPWVSGAAEIFAVVSGVQPDQAKATLTIVDMPYLDHDGTDYTPNQIMIFWPEYRYAAANVQLFEHDDNTNYKDLAVALAQGVTSILGAFAPTYAVIGQVATAILQAMPAGWFANDDDYVDSFYTLEKGRTYTGYRGAAGNATVSLSPYTLQSQ
ncbi:DUF3103 family protein [Massilia sp. CF038]|uniref:DUF3103 family protein n=1 Tax=Massilia sp. CF038 TaxID=1881045 RepID=UPI00091FD5D7|nr:DUF3103 family protein [Massilia sp. CF038]SHH67732.1 Protein of unknown function [Massilia sp. CF038]